MNRADFPVTQMCQVLGLSTSGYYAWLKRAPSARSQVNSEVLERMKQIHRFSRESYGRPRMYAELHAEGKAVNHYPPVEVAGDGAQQGCAAGAGPGLSELCRHPADQLWVADTTYIPTGSGFLYHSVVVDAWSRRVVGWSMETHLRTDLVLQTLNMALGQRRPTSVIHHSDQGTQYTANAFGARCKEAGVRPSMGSVGDAYDKGWCSYCTP